MEEGTIVELRVGADSDVLRLARTLLAVVEKNGNVVSVRAIGASATNQAIKAIARARYRSLQDGHDLVVRPSFMTVDSTRPGTSGSNEISGMVLDVEVLR